ncbi:MAG TPA: hypothetical protein DIC19_02500 [Erysipelotrichaceae bacterium]|nr:hypothetical protein [Erysipelotrichaceae bacterium]
MATVFTMLYVLIPYQKVKFIEVFPGVVFTMGAWLAISMLFSYFVNNFTNYANIYGSISGIIILLIWLNLSCLFLLLGGEINASVAYFNNLKKIINQATSYNKGKETTVHILIVFYAKSINV